MTFTIRVAAEAWRGQVQDLIAGTSAAGAELVPVIKGNGYGLGQRLLAREATRFGFQRIAVGTVYEAVELLPDFAGEITVLEPVIAEDVSASAKWLQLAQTGDNHRLVRTVSDVAGLNMVCDLAAGAPVLLELGTQMRRFGAVDPGFWQQVAECRDKLNIIGVTAHLPLPPTELSDSTLAPALSTLGADQPFRLSVSHLQLSQLAALHQQHPQLQLQHRVGTGLWLGNRSSITASGTVLAVSKADGALGYRQRSARGGHVVTVSGGTSHGIGLAAPAGDLSLRSRAVALATGGLQAVGVNRSPFVWNRKHLQFLEPPHQHVSMLVVPAGVEPPLVGNELVAEVRYTTTRADVVAGLE